MEDIPMKEESNEEEMLTPPCATHSTTFTLEEPLVYQFKMMNTRFGAMKENIMHYGSRLSNIETSVSRFQWNQEQFIRDKNHNFDFSLDLYRFYYPLDDTKELKTPHKERATLTMMSKYYLYSSSCVLHILLR